MDGIVKTFAKHAGALKASMRGSFSKTDGDWGKWWNEFTMDGAKTAFARIDNVEDLKKRIESDFAFAASRAGRDKSAWLKAKRGGKAVIDVVENLNDGVENAARLAVYRAARESGLSRKQAGSIAKNITVNFNRRGQFGPAINALYLFYNASVQGNVRILQAIYHSKKVRGIVGGIAVAGLVSEMLNSMASDDDEDGESFYDKIPAYEKERNIIVMLDGENYAKIPMPWGYNVFWEMGRTAGEVSRRPERWQNSAANMATTILGAFNPIGFNWEGRSAQEAIVSLLMPTAADPVVDLAQNRDFTGRPIMPEENQYGTSEPDAQRYWPGVNTMWKGITDELTELTGGNEIEPGAIDISPETLDYLSNTIFGAAGGFFNRTASIPFKAAEGELTAKDIPVIRKAIGNKSPYQDKATFYERISEVEQRVDDGKDYLEAEMVDELTRFIEDHERVLMMEGTAKEARKLTRQIRKDRRLNDELLEKGEIDEADYDNNKAHLDTIEQTVITNFNRQWNETVYDMTVDEPLE